MDPVGAACSWPGLPPPVEVEAYYIDRHPCNYLAGREATFRMVGANRISGLTYHRFMNAGFRRSGNVIYQPICQGCRKCQPLRILAATFQPTKSQRRRAKMNSDVAVSARSPRYTDETFALYQKYLAGRHDGSMTGQHEEFTRFLLESPVDSIEFCYRDASGKLLGVGVCDICPLSLSSVYFYFDPDESRRSLGVFSVLWEIEHCRVHGIPWYYMGYWVDGCATMAYKADYRPHQLLEPDGSWRDVP